MKRSVLKGIRALEGKTSRAYHRSKLHVHDGGRNTPSGVRATVFGATGFIGNYVAAALGDIGSEQVFPHNHFPINDDDVKELKVSGGLGTSVVIPYMDFNNKLLCLFILLETYIHERCFLIFLIF